LETLLHELVRGLFEWRTENEECRIRGMHRGNNLLERTRRFAPAIISFCEALPKDEISKVLGRQLLCSGTSVGANYRPAHRAKSKPDFVSKMGTMLEEADECCYWVELLAEAGKADPSNCSALHREADELVAIAVSSITTARRNSAMQG
jgi:four helix bundle protein